ncbi:MAG TPA: hypothetical protein VND91_05435 [Candidatus Saccharimonadia bacterium]|nr:hypothetical protein [Candidatus Saccharimonadia bacterium]
MTERPLISLRGNKRCVRRDSAGRFAESDATGRSGAQDGRQEAGNVSKPGEGDHGDRHS